MNNKVIEEYFNCQNSIHRLAICLNRGDFEVLSTIPNIEKDTTAIALARCYAVCLKAYEVTQKVEPCANIKSLLLTQIESLILALQGLQDEVHVNLNQNTMRV